MDKELKIVLVSRSIQEEAVGCLWIIAALLAFKSNHPVWGYLFAIKGSFGHCCAIIFAIKAGINDRKAPAAQSGDNK